jgi:hypothetical protein
MSEVRPEFTYSPEGILSITTGLSETFDQANITAQTMERMVADRRYHLELLADESTTTIEETEGVVNLRVNVPARFEGSFNNQGDPDIANFLANLDMVLPLYPEDQIDRVVDLDILGSYGFNANVNHHFQRWLNIPGVREEAAHHSLLAMALPFGADVVSRTNDQFDYMFDDNSEVATATSFRLVVRNDEFGVEKTERTPDATLEYDGKVRWRWLDISTLGDCACLGVAGDERTNLRLDPDTMRLYEMSPHNIDFARQSLSLILGVGALAHHAAQYEGTEDIFIDAVWQEPRVYPSVER